MQRQVLGCHAVAQLARDFDRHVLHLARPQGLRGQNMFDFRRADAVRERPERAMRRGMAIAADNRHARLSPPLFRADNMDDAIIDVPHWKELNAVLGDISRQGSELVARGFVLDTAQTLRLILCGRVVISDGQCQIRSAHTAPSGFQAGKCLRRCDLVNEVQINEEKRLTGRCIFADNVLIPDFIVEGLACHACSTFPGAPISTPKAILQASRYAK